MSSYPIDAALVSIHSESDAGNVEDAGAQMFLRYETDRSDGTSVEKVGAPSSTSTTQRERARMMIMVMMAGRMMIETLIEKMSKD